MHETRWWKQRGGFRILKSVATVMASVCGMSTTGQQTNFPPGNRLVSQLIAENGGNTNALPKFTGDEKSVREVTRDKYGGQVWFNGKQLIPLLEMLTAVYGKPVFARTNNEGLTMFQFNKS